VQAIINLTIVSPHGVQETVNFTCDKDSDTASRSFVNMSEFSTAMPNAASKRGMSSADHAVAQVEKWMAMIREISTKPREGQAQTAKAFATANEGASARPE
jgi:hypothetical protein